MRNSTSLKIIPQIKTNQISENSISKILNITLQTLPITTKPKGINPTHELTESLPA
jgi:hypothetical protein